jgi:hypothetical protein
MREFQELERLRREWSLDSNHIPFLGMDFAASVL